MINDYKPTHDPNIDTFKVEYLLGGSALLAIVFPEGYTFSEVGVGWITERRIAAVDIDRRSFGHFRFGWSRSPSFLSSSCCNGRVKPKR